LTAVRAGLYRIHGLLVESEIPLQGRGLETDGDRSDAESGGATYPVPDHRIVAGNAQDCPHSPPPGRILAEVRDDDGYAFWATVAPRDPCRRILRYAGICEAVLDRRRRTITVHPAPGTDPGLITIFIEGSVLANALAADGLLALHASAVEVEGRTLAIVGPSGAGKSTLAALLCIWGSRLVADDVLRVDPTLSGPICFPGSRSLRLRPAAASLGSAIGEPEIEETADGRIKVTPADPIDGPLKLVAVLVPEPSREAERLQVRRLGSMEGLQELLRYPRLADWKAPEPIAQLFRLTAEVAGGLSVYRATVPWGPPFQPRLAEELLVRVGLLGESRRAGTKLGAAATSDRQGAQ
jgi:hypothetical protein